jgi:nucleotide-binding universal stress UspA family protein
LPKIRIYKSPAGKAYFRKIIELFLIIHNCLYICQNKPDIMKKILVPIDFSESVKPAIKFAGNLARKTGAELHLIHVINVPGMGEGKMESGEWALTDDSTSGDIPLMMFMMKKIKEKMQALKESEDLKDVKLVDNIETGSPAVQITEAATKYNVDIIVMGTHGSSGWNEIFVGSNAEKVVRASPVPVLSIKDKVNINPQKIVFVSDFKEEANAIFPFAKRIAEIFDAKLFLLKVNTLDTFETTRELNESINRFKTKHNVPDYPVEIYNDMDKETGILYFAKDINADMIIAGTHGRTGISRMFSGSITEELVNHSFCPVLTIHFDKK